MSQDGSWTDPDPHPGGEAFVPRGTPPGRYAEETWSQYSARLERERRELEERAEMLGAIVAALVQKHGENVGTSEAPRYRVALPEDELERGQGGTLSTNLDPCSGALLIRFRPE